MSEITEKETKKYPVKDKTIKVGARLVVEFTKLSHEGLGIAKLNGDGENGEKYENFLLFVMGALPNEKGLVEIIELQKNLAYGKAIRIFSDTYAKERAQPKCESYMECGGCNIMHIGYTSQLAFKRQMVNDTIVKIAGITNLKIEPVIGMEMPFYYRNKVQVPFGMDRYKTTAGFYRRETHNIIPLEKCYIQSDKSTEIVKFIRNICNEFKINGYKEKYHEGVIRHVLIKSNFDESEMMIVLVSMLENFPHIDEIIQKIINRYPFVVSIVVNVNKQRGNSIMGQRNIVVYGKPYITDQMLGLNFQIGATSFYQVNPEQTRKLYEKTISLANFQKDDIVIDAYCGIGTIGLIAARHVKQVYGVEIVEEAVANAIQNAQINDINNATFICAKAEDQIVKWYHEGVSANIIIVDPPRKGCNSQLLEIINQMKIPIIIYVSCNPATLARDLHFLTENNYWIEVIQPVDMFPHSSHIENIVVLRRIQYENE